MKMFSVIVNYFISLWHRLRNKYGVVNAETKSNENVLLPINNSPGRYLFYCPGCEANHMINTKPEGNLPCHTLTGTLDKPTIRASVLSIGNKKIAKPHCHSFITDGKIEFLSDCTHHLAGHTVPLEPL